MKKIPHTKMRTGPQIKIQRIMNNGRHTMPTIIFISNSSNGNKKFHSHPEIGISIDSTVNEIAPTKAVRINKIIGIVIATKTDEQTIPAIE